MTRTAPRLGSSAFDLETRLTPAAHSIQSVVVMRDEAPNPMTYHIDFGGIHETRTLQPGQSRLYEAGGANKTAVVEYDASAAAGYQGRRVELTSKNFVAGGPEAAAVRTTADGMDHDFVVNSARTGWTVTSPTHLDTTRNAGLRASAASGFENMGTNFEVVAGPTGASTNPSSYNCISWSLGEVNKWTFPQQPDVRQAADIRVWDALYAAKGYRRISTLDLSHEAGVQKVVLYWGQNLVGQTASGQKVYTPGYTHAALQETDGTWSSKLGGGCLVKTASAYQVAGQAYGQPAAVYVRDV